MGIEIIEENGKVIIQARKPSIEGERISKRWDVNWNAYPIVAKYLDNLRRSTGIVNGVIIEDDVIIENGVRIKKSERIYELTNRGKITIGDNPFGGVRIRVQECPEEIFKDLNKISYEMF